MKEVQQLKSPTTLDAIGKTPIVQLRKIVPKGSADIFVKLEYFNPTGSYKDRMALAMICLLLDAAVDFSPAGRASGSCAATNHHHRQIVLPGRAVLE